MKRNTVMILVLLLTGLQFLRAGEGMWIPALIERYQIDRMQEAGLRLEAEDIYSINQECLKDAIVRFGSGCTGEMISGEGLVLTNHHCGEEAIQSHSTLEHDYLTSGYWALNREEELPNWGLSVRFLRYMEDVTSGVNEGVVQGMDPAERERTRELNQGRIIREATRGTHYDAELKPFYFGNAYYLFVYEEFRDVRLVGAPPSSIGNFGADHDNWMWPRHTGDFSLFRVYADGENNPADYSPSNIPYKPRKYLEISVDGIQDGDYTMIMGYPAKTQQYLYSAAVQSLLEASLPLKIGLRTTRLEIMDHYMKQSEAVRIQYAHKYRRVSNAWKKWQGVILGLNRNHVVERKKEEEDRFRLWVDGDGERQMKYDQLLDGFSRLYDELEWYTLAMDLLEEALRPVELSKQADQVLGMMQRGLPAEEIESQVERFFKDFHMPVDRDIFAAMLEVYHLQMPGDFHPGFFERVQKKYKGDFSRFAGVVYGKAIFSDRERATRLLDVYRKKPDNALKRLRKDPMILFLNQFREIYFVEIHPEYYRLRREEEGLYKTYLAGLMEMSAAGNIYPDANRTMRITYGEVKGYQPRDGVKYQYSTTLSGLMEKNREGHPDYTIPSRLAELYQNKDFGRYGTDGTLPVCFIATNHTSGGNSGSPVLDEEGRLIGLNFDRDWEGTMSDYYYDPSLCRNIAVDIRYVLFIIEKFAGAGYLLNEMDIIW